jgi:cytochrome P450
MADAADGGPRELPRAGLRTTLRSLAGGRGERIDMLSRLRELSERHGAAVAQVVGPLRMVNLFGPDANRLVLLDRDRIFSAEQPWTRIMGRIFRGGLLLKDGLEHRHHRKIMHEAFKRPALRGYLDHMNPMIARALDDWGRGDGSLLAFRAFKELTLDMAAAIFVGVDLGPDTQRMNAAFESMVAASMSRLRLPIPGLEFQRGLSGRETMTRYLGGLLAKKRADAGPDMFSRLCRGETEEGDRLRDQEVVDHMIFLMMAAHDTTTSTLCSLAYELARHPEWQERLRQEGRALAREALGFEDLERLPQLGWVMKETLRRYPPLPVIPRIATAEFTWAGYRVPKGSLVVVAPIHTHHMAEWWEEPWRFDPERFAPGRAEHERHSHAWVPFGGGPHHCLGMRFAEIQIAAVAHALLQRYRWSVAPGYRMPVQQAPISKPMDGLPLRLEPLH